MTPVQPVGTAVSMLLASVAWSAVLLQLWLSIQLGFSNGKSLLGGLVVFFGYFTVLTNIFVALVGTAGALGKPSKTFLWLYRPSTVGCATTAILMVGLAYYFLLRKIWSPQGAQLLADVLLHYVVPVGALCHWLVYRHSEPLARWAPLGWCLYPLAYLVYALTRGALLSSYPYPFIDVTALGYQQVLINAAGLLVAFLTLGFAIHGLARFVSSRRADKGKV